MAWLDAYKTAAVADQIARLHAEGRSLEEAVGIVRRRLSHQRYNRSEKGRARYRMYDIAGNGWFTRWKYERSEKGRARKRRYWSQWAEKLRAAKANDTAYQTHTGRWVAR